MRGKSLVLVLACVWLVGCSGMKIDDFTATKPTLRPEEFFAGKTKAWGIFQDRFGTVRRQMIVDIDGKWDGKELVLTEDFTYSDGETEQRVWHIRPTGPNTYEGEAKGVVGSATGTANGQALNWKYQFDLPVKDSVWRVSFDDWMLQQDADTMINRATISKYGFTIGEVTLFFQRLPAPVEPAKAAAAQEAERPAG